MRVVVKVVECCWKNCCDRVVECGMVLQCCDGGDDNGGGGSGSVGGDGVALSGITGVVEVMVMAGVGT